MKIVRKPTDGEQVQCIVAEQVDADLGVAEGPSDCFDHIPQDVWQVQIVSQGGTYAIK